VQGTNECSRVEMEERETMRYSEWDVHAEDREIEEASQEREKKDVESRSPTRRGSGKGRSLDPNVCLTIGVRARRARGD